MNRSTIARLGIVFAAATIAAGCSSTKVAPPAPQPPAPAPVAAAAPPPPPPPAQPARQPPPPAPAMDPLDDPNSPLAKRSVYFDFDKSQVHDQDLLILEAHGNYLGGHAGRKVRIEGNCDERGGREYNLALGQRRADAVAHMLALGGARKDQLETISYGKERPRAPGHDEAAWSQNRRADIVYR